MKKQILLLFIGMGMFIASCGKKESMQMDITMNYNPNPALKNTAITFTFDVMQDGALTKVESPSCEVIKGSTTNAMSISEVKSGQYTGTYTFTEAGTHELHFKYMHGKESYDKDFSVTIQ